MSPLHTAFMLVTDALFGATTVAPHAHAHVLRRIAATAPVERAFRPIVASAFRGVPDVVVPMGRHAELTLDDHLDQLAAARHSLATDFAAGADGEPAFPWRVVADRPALWLEAMGAVSTAAWDVVSPLMTAAGPLLEAEVIRVGTAVVRGDDDVLLNSLTPRLRWVGDTVTLDGRPETRTTLDGRDLVLIPMLAGDDTVLLQLDSPYAVHVGYPLPGGAAAVAGAVVDGRDGAGSPADRASTLAGLLGRRRAAILSQLDRPRSMGEVAVRAGISPATATHHCDHLEAAGLVRRIRAGRSVLVGRSARGTALLATWETSAPR